MFILYTSLISLLVCKHFWNIDIVLLGGVSGPFGPKMDQNWPIWSKMQTLGVIFDRFALDEIKYFARWFMLVA